MSRGLGWIQRKALARIRDEGDFSLTSKEIASHVFSIDWIEHNQSERRSTSRALKGLVARGEIYEHSRGRYSTKPRSKVPA